jgi:SNF2 family DNA or RNA helicase
MIDLPIKELINWFDPDTVSRGVSYANKNHVIWSRLESDDNIIYIEAEVRGSQNKPYRVTVEINPTEKNIDGDCTCPIGYNCKHVVAAIMTVKMPGTFYIHELQLDEEPSHAISAWMNTIDKAVNPSYLEPDNSVVVFVLNHRVNHYSSSFLSVHSYLARFLKKGRLGLNPKNFYPSTESKRNKVSPEALDIFALLTMYNKGNYGYNGEYLLEGKDGPRVIKRLLDTGHCYWQRVDSMPLIEGPEIYAQATWEMQEDGTQQFVCKLPTPSYLLLPTEPLWYVNPETSTMGVIRVDLSQKATSLLHLPPIPPTQVQRFISQLTKKIGNETAFPLPKTFQEIISKTAKPQPHLYIHSQSVNFDISRNSHKYNITTHRLILATLSFYYDGIKIFSGDKRHHLMRVNEQTLIRCVRNLKQEQQYTHELHKQYQLVPLVAVDKINQAIYHDQQLKHSYYISHENDIDQIVHFKETIAPHLKNSGWIVEYAEDYLQYDYIEIESWYADLNEKSEFDWFSFQLGIIVNGERVNLLPYLVDAIQHSKLKKTSDNRVILALPDVGLLPIPAERINLIMSIIMQLIDSERFSGKQEIQLSRYHATLLVEMEKAFNASELRWFGDNKLRQLGKKLSNFKSLKNVSVPKSFLATLRPYQREGVNWLQFLRKFQLNGILADDMGLGKTVQTLAHLSVEKQNNRLTKPCLIIAPTSVVHNWQREILRFSPYFKTLVLQGMDRKIKFNEICKSEVVLTTYPLIVRDKEVLLEQQYYIVILDEAQNIKNAQAKMTQIVQQLKAEHRLCLTGTPLENHLGELWSLFHFLLPGLLGNSRDFKSRYRIAIEKHQDADCQQRLFRLTKPFILRRSKQEVVKELPQKTEIIHSVELGKQQRDLYESIRLAMHKKIKKAIDQKGIERSQIIILDALLKLRQVCCDPRLVKIDAAKKINESAKLEGLLDILVEMCEEGRRILLFSQFTSMLSLIEEELKVKKIQYVKLTGRTIDRSTPIRKFQEGNIPLFLISLKAGGTGLNLTAADTVIHYDPWWNPAVEQQATDRAHRIGQEKAVFVYKLVAVNTVEEKILEMQKKKKSLLDALLNGANHKGKLTKEDLNILFT